MNKNILRFCVCFLILISVIPHMLFAASFDCSKASTKTEKTICKDPVLSKLDDDLAAAYSKAIKSANNDIVKKKQRKWLKEILAPCQEDTVCIKSAYETRIDELNSTVVDAVAEDQNRQGVLVTTYNPNSTLCKHFYSLYSSFKECPLTDGYCFRFKWDSTDDSAIRKIPLQELAINQYGYTQINVAYPINKPYAIVYLDGFNGDRNPRLQETWRVNAKELQALTAREPHPLPYDKWILREPQIEKETYSAEFAKLLSHGEKISNDWSPAFTVDGVDYVVEIKCVEHFEFGGYNICDQITKMTIKRIGFELKATPVCEFAKTKRK